MGRMLSQMLLLAATMGAALAANDKAYGRERRVYRGVERESPEDKERREKCEEMAIKKAEEKRARKAAKMRKMAGQ